MEDVGVTWRKMDSTIKNDVAEQPQGQLQEQPQEVIAI